MLLQISYCFYLIHILRNLPGQHNIARIISFQNFLSYKWILTCLVNKNHKVQCLGQQQRSMVRIEFGTSCCPEFFTSRQQHPGKVTGHFVVFSYPVAFKVFSCVFEVLFYTLSPFNYSPECCVRVWFPINSSCFVAVAWHLALLWI